LAVTENASVAGNLSVTGNYASTDGDISLTNGDLTLTNGTVTTKTLAVTENASVAGNLSVTGNYASTDGNINLSNGTLNVGGAVTFGNTLNVTGASTFTGAITANGGATINNGATVNNGFVANSGSGSGNYISVNSTASTLAANSGEDTINSISVGTSNITTIDGNAVKYGTTVNGGMLVNGDLGVNGNIYSLNPTANASVKVAENGLVVTGSTSAVGLVSDTNSSTEDGRAQVSLTPNTASLTVTNDIGNSHGISINNSQTVLSGGTTSTHLTLDDNGAAFSSTSGEPVKVTGVADGTGRYDAVNYGQLSSGLRQVQSGVASASAMANIPQVDQSKRFSLGAGFGTFMNSSSFAIGASARITDSTVVKTSVAHSSYAKPTFGVGVGYSW
jgi:hypothetical protein